jgi:hypothetical protein
MDLSLLFCCSSVLLFGRECVEGVAGALEREHLVSVGMVLRER